MKNIASFLPCTVLIVMLTLGVPVGIHYVSTPAFRKLAAEPVSGHDILAGVTAGKLERVYKDEFPIRDFSTGSLNALSLGLFGEARKGAIVGADHWFFTDEEFTWNRHTPGIIEENLHFVETVAAELANKDVALVVALIPEKADVYRAELGAVSPTTWQATGYEAIQSRLSTVQHLTLVDLREPFIDMKQNEQLFLKSDTHWTPDGAGIAAQTIASAITLDPSIKRSEYALIRGQSEPYSGDLYKFIRLSVFDSYFKLPLDQLVPITAQANSDDLDSLLGEDTEPTFNVALVGTSYSANSRWGFADQLKAAMSVDILNVAEEGGGPFMPMQKFLDETLNKNPTIKTVIWEIPLRYFRQVYTSRKQAENN